MDNDPELQALVTEAHIRGVRMGVMTTGTILMQGLEAVTETMESVDKAVKHADGDLEKLSLLLEEMSKEFEG